MVGKTSTLNSLIASPDVQEKIDLHPCYGIKNISNHARLHLPVAPLCNIQCNFCNRKFDCINESRPGVTSRIINVDEVSDLLDQVLAKIPQLKVVGIAGPGDPLANPEEVLSCLELVHKKYPLLKLCLSTNGLMLSTFAKDLVSIGLEYITVTVNAVDVEIARNIYSWVIDKNQPLTGTLGAELLLERQAEGIREVSNKGVLVKINTILIPGINEDHIPTIAQRVKKLGATMMNIIPLIPLQGTAFSMREAPRIESMQKIRNECGSIIRIMRHCQQCRADAVGMLGDDRSMEFNRTLSHQSCTIKSFS
jgi:nitrogen fixation protein NifB